jgi:hypothetical protein
MLLHGLPYPQTGTHYNRNMTHNKLFDSPLGLVLCIVGGSSWLDAQGDLFHDEVFLLRVFLFKNHFDGNCSLFPFSVG